MDGFLALGVMSLRKVTVVAIGSGPVDVLLPEFNLKKVEDAPKKCQKKTELFLLEEKFEETTCGKFGSASVGFNSK